MKVALLADTHAGIRNDSLLFDNESREFFETIFFPYIDKHQIKTVLHMGDVFDRRKFINFQILQNVKNYFFDAMVERDMECSIIIGNHDVYYKNTNEVNSLKLLLSEYNNVTIIDSPSQITIGGTSIAAIPWICDENRDETMEFLGKTKSKICMGHLEIRGFEMQKGMGALDTGEFPETFQKFDLVLSGHYHHKSTIGNINYLGCTSEFTWSDFSDPKGFHIFDTDDNSLEFIRNPKELHKKIFYDESNMEVNPKDYKNTIVKIIVTHKEDFKKFDKFIERLYHFGVFDVKILEDLGDMTSVIDETVNVEDTKTLLSEYVDGMEIDLNKERLKKLLNELYIEAIHTEI